METITPNWGALEAGLLMMCLTFVAGFALAIWYGCSRSDGQ